MGQRHQIYCFYYARGKDNKQELTCTAFHNQWCYGSLPLRHVQRLAKFQKNADKSICFSPNFSIGGEVDKLKCILSVDVNTGYYQHYLDVSGEAIKKLKSGIKVDPDTGDNNDGITIVLFPRDSKRIKYCFTESLENKTPLSAKEYALNYYKEQDKEWKGTGIYKLVPWIDKNCDLLSVSECIKLLPEWYKESELKKIVDADEKQLLLLVDCKPENRPILEKRMRGLPV
jgi:hypothetical protein